MPQPVVGTPEDLHLLAASNVQISSAFVTPGIPSTPVVTVNQMPDPEIPAGTARLREVIYGRNTTYPLAGGTGGGQD